MKRFVSLLLAVVLVFSASLVGAQPLTPARTGPMTIKAPMTFTGPVTLASTTTITGAEVVGASSTQTLTNKSDGSAFPFTGVVLRDVSLDANQASVTFTDTHLATTSMVFVCPVASLTGVENMFFWVTRNTGSCTIHMVASGTNTAAASLSVLISHY